MYGAGVGPHQDTGPIADVAMTGEITLRGEVLPIGGLKEKLLAAHRGGIETVMIPIDNEKDLAEIPDNIKGNLEIAGQMDRRGTGSRTGASAAAPAPPRLRRPKSQ